MDSDESTATKEIARMLLEQLQESGERDRMKEWLFRELDTAGWKKSLSEQASKIVKARNAESESKEAAHDGNSSSAARGTSGKITAKELATNLSAFGHGKRILILSPCSAVNTHRTFSDSPINVRTNGR